MSDAFSCFIRIRNASPHHLKIAAAASEGEWAEPPITSLTPGEIGPWMRVNPPVGRGLAGSITVNADSGEVITGSFTSSRRGKNAASVSSRPDGNDATWTFEGAVGKPEAFVQRKVPGGHPAYIRYTFAPEAFPDPVIVDFKETSLRRKKR